MRRNVQLAWGTTGLALLLLLLEPAIKQEEQQQEALVWLCCE